MKLLGFRGMILVENWRGGEREREGGIVLRRLGPLRPLNGR